MTIAMCYVLHEGVILGADSTSSTQRGGFHYFNHNQKLFEVGEGATIGVLTWGLGSLQASSHRTILADFAADLSVNPASNVLEVASRWVDIFYNAYDSDAYLNIFRSLQPKAQHDSAIPPTPGMRTQQEEELCAALRDALVVGFCVAGRAGATRTPDAYEVVFDPLGLKPVPNQIPLGTYRFWGVPNMADRLIVGTDSQIKATIVNSPHWVGTESDFDTILASHRLSHPALPIRDAIDFVHMCIHSTIKALKFSAYSQVCGGPIEIATITTDRQFRWVRHKPWDAALLEGEQ